MRVCPCLSCVRERKREREREGKRERESEREQGREREQEREIRAKESRLRGVRASGIDYRLAVRAILNTSISRQQLAT